MRFTNTLTGKKDGMKTLTRCAPQPTPYGYLYATTAPYPPPGGYYAPPLPHPRVALVGPSLS
jgi:hypothetical protein